MMKRTKDKVILLPQRNTRNFVSLRVALLIFFFCQAFIFQQEDAFLYAQCDTWTQKADFAGLARVRATGFSIGNKGYIGTGWRISAPFPGQDFWEYDAATDVWTQKADFAGTGRDASVGFSIGGKGYIGTGDQNAGSMVQDFWEYDTTSNAWTQKTDVGGPVRGEPVGFSIGGKGYIGTGFDNSWYVQQDFWEYDTSSNTWTQKADFAGGARSGAVGFSIGDKGYIGTGRNGSGTKFNDFWEYNPDSNIWAQKADFGGTTRSSAAGFSIDGKGFIGGGSNSNSTGSISDFWEYDRASDSWIQIANYGGGNVESPVGFAIGKKGYVGTGIDGGGVSKVFWEYTPGITVKAGTDTAICSNNLVIGGNPTASGVFTDYVYNWSPTIGLSDSTIENPTALLSSPITYYLSVSDSNGCVSTDSIVIYYSDSLSFGSTVTGTSFYGCSDGSATSAVSGGLAPYSYLWSNGDSTQNIDSVPANTYSVTITDFCGINIYDSVVINEPSLSLVDTLNISDVSCKDGTDGTISLLVSGGPTPFSFLWSNGDTTQDISGLGIGTYSVLITDYCGTSISDSITISEPIAALSTGTTITDVNCFSGSDGAADLTVAGGTLPYSYSWSNSTFSQNLSGVSAGTYIVTVIDSNGCTISDTSIIVQPLAALATTITASNSSCLGACNGIADLTVTGGTSPYTYLWSNSETTQDAFDLCVATYDVTVTDTNNCQTIDNVTTSSDATPTQEICMITVDSTSSRNIIVWEKPSSAGTIGSYNIYRDIIGVYTLVGSVNYDSLSLYVDTVAGINPNVTSYRYKISVVDTCGNESGMSTYHETIHLVTVFGSQAALIWDNYEGFGFNYYRLLRDEHGTGAFIVLDSVSNSVTSWIDLNPPNNANLTYAIEVVAPFACLATKQTSFSTSRSNSATSDLVGINQPISNLHSLNIYPNPTNGNFRIEAMITGNTDAKIKIVNAIGQCVYTELLESGKYSHKIDIDLSTSSAGLYTIQLVTSSDIVSRKIAIQH